MAKVPGEQHCHHTLNSTPGLTKHPLINKQWGEWLNIDPPSTLVLSFWQALLHKESRGGGLPCSAPRWAPSCWVQHHGERNCDGCVCVCVDSTPGVLSVWVPAQTGAVNTSPADGNDVKPTSNLISPLSALSSLTPSFSSSICLCGSLFTVSSDLCASHTLTPTTSLLPHVWHGLTSFLRMLTVHSFAITKDFNAPSPWCPHKHFSFHNPPTSCVLRTSIHCSVCFQLQDHFLLFTLKGR